MMFMDDLASADPAMTHHHPYTPSRESNIARLSHSSLPTAGDLTTGRQMNVLG